MNFLQQGEQMFGNQGGGGGGGGLDISSFGNIIQHANSNSQGGSGDGDMFGRVAGMLQNKAGNMDPNDVNEDSLINDHDAVHNSNSSVGSNQIGNAAALGAIKNTIGGGGGGLGALLGGGGGGGSNSSFQEKLIGMAMANAGNMFDQKNSNGQAEGSKEDAMHQAGETVMKLLMKNQMSGMIGGGQTSGLSSLAKFLM